MKFRLKSVEEELNGLDKMLIQDNLVRNRIGADKGMVESLIDKLKVTFQLIFNKRKIVSFLIILSQGFVGKRRRFY